MDIYAIREGLAACAANVVLAAGRLRLTATAYLPDAVVEPCFFIAEYEQDFDKTMRRGMDEITFTCRVLVGKSDELSSQRLLDSMLSGSGPASLKAALEAGRGGPGEPALNGACDDFQVVRMQGNRWYEHAGNHYIGAELTVKVIGSGE